MLQGVISGKEIKGKMFLVVAKEFGVTVALRCWWAVHDKAHNYRFLDLAFGEKIHIFR